MKNNLRIGSIFFMLLLLVLVGCQGSKERVNYEPQPDPFPEPVRTTETDTDSNTDMNTNTDDLFGKDDMDDLNKKLPLEFNTVFFEFDMSSLTDNAKATLAQNALVLQQYPNTYIRIEGHCDERGTVEYNLALGERRALSVRNYLINYGISPGRITIISYGKERPLDPRSSESAWAKNRRAEFIILNR